MNLNNNKQDKSHSQQKHMHIVLKQQPRLMKAIWSSNQVCRKETRVIAHLYQISIRYYASRGRYLFKITKAKECTAQRYTRERYTRERRDFSTSKEAAPTNIIFYILELFTFAEMISAHTKPTWRCLISGTYTKVVLGDALAKTASPVTSPEKCFIHKNNV